MKYILKLQRFGGRNNTSYGITIPKEMVEKYEYNKENYVKLEENEYDKTLIIKKIPYE